MQCGQSVQLLNVKLLVHHVTSRLQKLTKKCFTKIKIYWQTLWPSYKYFPFLVTLNTLPPQLKKL